MILKTLVFFAVVIIILFNIYFAIRILREYYTSIDAKLKHLNDKISRLNTHNNSQIYIKDINTCPLKT